VQYTDKQHSKKGQPVSMD